MLTSHSHGAEVSHFSSAILGLDFVTFAGRPANINSLPKKYKEEAKFSWIKLQLYLRHSSCIFLDLDKY